MSMPNIPTLGTLPTFNTEDVRNLLLISIALEELGLAHIINAEAEKIQFALGTLNNGDAIAESIDDLEDIDNSVRKTLQDVIKKEMLLQFKLEQVVGITIS